MSVILQAFAVGALEANCYVVGDEDSREVLVIDPGDDAAKLLDYFRSEGLRVSAVLATHHHLDHTGAVHELLEGLPDARFYMHRADYSGIVQGTRSAAMWYGRAVTPPREPDRHLEHGDRVEVGRHAFRALHVPGHTRGSLCLYGEDMVFTGDALFAGSVGRSDFPGGDAKQLIESIRAHLLSLPDHTTVFPGHNGATTIGEEREDNPFLNHPRRLLGIDLD